MEPDTQKQTPTTQKEEVGLKQLFRYADKTDYILIAVGSAFSILLGTAIPVFAYMMGSMIDAFTDPNTIYEQSKTIFYAYISLGFAALIIAWVMFTTWTVMGERQGINCRRQYFKSLIRQQIAWFDMNKQSQISSTFSANALTFQQAVGQKLSTLIMLTSMLCSGLGISFYLGWELTLIILGYLPIIIICWSNNIKTKTQVASKQDKIYLKSDAKAQQSLIAIKLVKQMNGQDFQSKSSQQMLKEVSYNYLQASKKYILAASIAILSLYLAFALTFWFGSQCIFNTEKCPQRLNPTKYTAGNVIKIFYSLILPAISLNQLTPSILKIKQGKAAAAKLFSIIDRVPLIRSIEDSIIPQTFRGVIKFQNVSFAYPKQKNVKILQNLNMEIDCRSSAIIGASGCGKSTILQLIMRFYDPDEGTVYLDGIDLKQINLQWLRSQIGYVGQEPVLFATTIRENMLLGKEHATQQQMYQALKKAQAYDFIFELKDKLDTFVGGGGNQLSGGQKQRIAIARALLKHPKILLLDEATSALDRKNEKQILTTLHSVGKQHITISITHRQKILDGCQKVFNFKNKKIQKITVNQMNQIKLLEKEAIVLQNQNDQNNTKTLQIPKLTKEDYKISMNTATKNTLVQGLDSSVALINNQEESNKQKSTKNHTLTRLFQFLFEKKCLFIFGFIVSVIQGAVFPAIGVFTAKVVASQLKYIFNNQFYSSEVRKYIYILLGTAFFGAINNPVMHFTFTVLGSNSVKTIRTKAYEKILRMPIEWFQKAENQPEIMISRLSSGCRTLYNFIQLYMPHCTTLFTNVIFSIIGAIIFEWRTGLTSVALIPLIILSQAIQFAYIKGLTQSKGKIFDESSQIVNENVMNIRTILSFGNPDSLQSRYNLKLSEIMQILMKKYLFSGFMFGISYFLQYLCFALMFFLSAIYDTKYNVDISDSLVAMFLIIFAAISAGNQTNFMQDISNAKIAAKNLFQILDLQDEHQIRQKLNSQKLKSQIRGNITFRNVSFKYNNRQVNALTNVSFTVKEGEKVGIVGQSGCGKSTILNLLLGFYYTTGGEIFLENININDYDLSYLRQVFGVVSQQPVLFDQSIRWNIKYNKTEVSEQQIIKASDEANFNPYTENQLKNQNILNFQTAQDPQILEGYSKCVGPRGSHVSGGQKQRIAIARTILRKPRILLLDQATSALDPQNEAKVQKSLDNIMKGRTTISITHRLQTIENADQIIVINRGIIEQIGTFQNLSTHNEHFCTLLRGSLIHD